MTIPVRGSSGPGAQIPMPETEWAREQVPARTESMAETTAANPAAASFDTIGVRVWKVISPAAFTRPAATLVPPTSTPIRCPSPETCVMRFALSSVYTFFAERAGRLNSYFACGSFGSCRNLKRLYRTANGKLFGQVGRVAQLVEQCPFKAWVAGSNPAALTSSFQALTVAGATGLPGGLLSYILCESPVIGSNSFLR
jgi:hypothetical protein